jgi:hypothetical protein
MCFVAQAAGVQPPQRPADDDFQIVPSASFRFANRAAAQSETRNAYPLFARPSFGTWSPFNNNGNANYWYSPALVGYGDNVAGLGSGYYWSPATGWSYNPPATNNCNGWNAAYGYNARYQWNPWTGWSGLNAAPWSPMSRWNTGTTGSWTDPRANNSFVNNSWNTNAPYCYYHTQQTWTRPQNLVVGTNPNGSVIHYTPPTVTTGMVNGYNPALPLPRSTPSAVVQPARSVATTTPGTVNGYNPALPQPRSNVVQQTYVPPANNTQNFNNNANDSFNHRR